ncbi:hypothetical protein SAMN04489760_12930 [Syntrophus gentianae]|uniref:Uncharacterized protein n=1 Tax=Syntrophus gentianae TaxID=43775 RepID=A0A1H8A0Q7_9BACT|nr:hypothetical protein [Syntrophus gentianae]SEM64300.1 hypothetical protein SAMN04489760_12930 [Syntrophus gentianae]
MNPYDLLARNLEEIQAALKDQESLLDCLRKGGDIPVLSSCVSGSCPHRQKFKETLLDAISVLEESRKSFRSKQLEALRKKLTRVLVEIA